MGLDKEIRKKYFSRVFELIDDKKFDEIGLLFEELAPEEIAEIIKHSDPDDKAKLFDLLDEEKKAVVIDDIDVRSKKHILEELPDDSVADIISDMEYDEAADVLNILEKDRQENVLDIIEEDETEVDEIEQLLTYDPYTAGGIMSKDYIAINETDTVQMALEKIRKTESQDESLSNLCIVDSHNHLLGTISIRELLANEQDAYIAHIYDDDPLSVNSHVDQEEAANIMMRYDLYTLCVVDNKNRLLGIIYADDIMDVITEEATEDIYKMVGSTADEVFELSILKVVKMRLPWLYVSIGLCLLSVIIIEINTDLQTSLIAFIPVVMAMSGNIGVQSSSIIIRGLATGRINIMRVRSFFFRELKIGTLLGLSCGITVGLIGTLIKVLQSSEDVHPWGVGISVAIALIISLSIAATLGAAIPVVLKKLHLDPAIATGPFVTTLNDVISIVIYFYVARIVLKLL